MQYFVGVQLTVMLIIMLASVVSDAMAKRRLGLAA